METLPKDIVEYITNKLSPQDFLAFSISYPDVYRSKEIFIRRIQKDFPYLIKQEINSREKYIRIFYKFHNVSNELCFEILETYGEVQKYLTMEYKKDISVALYEIFTKGFSVFYKSVENLIEENFDTSYKTTIKNMDMDKLFNLSLDIFRINAERFQDRYLPKGPNGVGYDTWNDMLLYNIKGFMIEILQDLWLNDKIN